MYRELDFAKLERTLRGFRSRIDARFPGSGLGGVSGELEATAQSCFEEVRRLGRPLWWLRATVVAAVLLLLALPAEALLFLHFPMHFNSFGEFIQATDAGFNVLLLLMGAAFFLFKAENRVKRGRALEALDELRSLAHVIDMHQIGKDPGFVGISPPNDGDLEDEPGTIRNSEDLWHYLSFCADLLAVTAKLAACFAQHQSDRTILDTISEIEGLSTNLSRKIWQKMSFIQIPKPVPVPTAGALQP